MGALPFDMDLIRSLAEHRGPLLTPLFQLFTFLGDMGGYILVVALIYVAWDKTLATRLAIVTLAAMSLNHLLKILIMNPRPFVAEGSHLEHWAVSPATAAALATEYSTPSGHAMAGAAFYAYLFANVKSRAARIACILAILMIGLSRPYLGVHYLEDVLLGWPLGAALALLAVRYAGPIGERWDRLSRAQQIAGVAAASLVLWEITRSIGGWTAPDAGPPLAFVSYTGFLMGIVVARPLEATQVAFDPRSGTPARKLFRYALCVALILGTLVLLDEAFAAISADDSFAGQTLRYVRYALAAIAGMYLGPLAFLKLGWADRASRPLPATQAGNSRACNTPS